MTLGLDLLNRKFIVVSVWRGKFNVFLNQIPSLRSFTKTKRNFDHELVQIYQ